MPYLDDVPSDPRFQSLWVDKAPNACDRLGRLWMVDSKNQGRTADYVLPAEEAKARMAALTAAMDTAQPKHARAPKQ